MRSALYEAADSGRAGTGPVDLAAQGLALALPGSVPAQVAIGAMASSIQSAVLGQALVPILVTATVLKAHGLGAVLVGSVMGLGVRNLLINGDIIPKN
jgi:hypothetical protein